MIMETNGEDTAVTEGRKAIIEPLFGRAFSRIFGRDESRDITRSLVNAILERAGLKPIGKIISIEGEHTEAPGSVECRDGRTDVRVIAEGRRLIDLESQRYPEDLEARSAFYAAQLIVANTPKGAKFKDVPQAIVITLLDDAPLLPETDGFLSVGRIRWESDGQPTDAPRAGAASEKDGHILFVLVELEKVRERYNGLSSEVLQDPLLSWLYLLTQGFEKAEEAEEIMCMYPDLREFAEMYGRAIDDPEVLRAYENEAAAYRNYHSRKDYFERVEREATERGMARGEAIGMEKGMERGMAKGMEEGMEKGMAELAEELRALGVPEETLSEALSRAKAE